MSSPQYFIACSQPWTVIGGGTPHCTGTLQVVSRDEINPQGLSSEDLSDYVGHVLILFAVVFGALAVKKAIF